MAPKIKQILLLMIPCLAVYTIFELMSPEGPITKMTPSGLVLTDSTLNRMTFGGVFITVSALSLLVASALMKRGKLKAGSWWGRSATELFWFGIAFLIIGLSNLSHLILGNTLEDNLLVSKLRLYAALIGLVLIVVGRFRAKAAREI